MNIGVLGTGMVGKVIGSKLVHMGHRVKMGSRTQANPKATEWAQANGPNASSGTFSDAAAFGEIIFNCISGGSSLEALRQAGAAHLKGKVLVDIANPLDFSKGMPPSLTVCNTDSLGEQIQRAFPDARVVKTLNTTNCNIMVNPGLVPGDHDMFICGNDSQAKATVTDILSRGFGWKTVIDLGDITNARATEMLLPIWVRLFSTFGSANFNFKIVHQ